MSSRKHSLFDHAVHRANAWVVQVAKSLGTEDRHLAYRALRAWLHTLRDRLSVDGAAHFGAQLPELLRGLYYDGWDPSHVPIKYGPNEYVLRFAQEARIPPVEVGAVGAAVTAAIRDQLSPGQLDGALTQLPPALRTLLVDGDKNASTAVHGVHALPAHTGSQGARTVDRRIDKLEARVALIAEALRVLAHGLETPFGAEPDEQRAPRAARQAYEILLTEPTEPASRQPA